LEEVDGVEASVGGTREGNAGGILDGENVVLANAAIIVSGIRSPTVKFSDLSVFFDIPGPQNMTSSQLPRSVLCQLCQRALANFLI
jgi:hypothetical protein